MLFPSLIGSSALFVLLLCISDSEGVKTLENLAVKRGGSLSVPCFYDEQYKLHRKYWCWGYHWSTCQIVAHTNTTGRTSVTDHPTQNMFTVELNSLQDSDSGSYWCAVEIGDYSVPDDRDYLYLTVSADPAVSVINSRVSGQEGGSVSVQCLCSAGYKNKQKQWCRFKDWSCYTVGRTVTSQNSAVQISDDRTRSFSVEMSGLQKSDAGWYWVSAGDVGVTVHLTVTEKPSSSTVTVKTVTALRTTASPSSVTSENIGSTVTVKTVTPLRTAASSAVTSENTGDSRTAAFSAVTSENTGDSRTAASSAVTLENTGDTKTRTGEHDKNRANMLFWVALAVGLGLLLIMISIITWMLLKKRKQTETRERIDNVAVGTPSPAAFDENDVIYANIRFHK